MNSCFNTEWTSGVTVWFNVDKDDVNHKLWPLQSPDQPS